MMDFETMTYRDPKNSSLFDGMFVRWAPREEFQQWADQNLQGAYEITFEHLELPRLVLNNQEDAILVRLTWDK